MQSLLNLNYQFVLRCDRMDPIDHHRVMQLLNEKLLAVTQDLDPSPRTCPTQNAVLCTYMRYFHRPPFAPMNMIPNPYKLSIPAAKLRVLLRFRTGCHDLPIVLGRLPGCRVHSAYVQLATLLKLVMSAILFLNALLCNKCVSDTPTYLLMMMLLRSHFSGRETCVMLYILYWNASM